MSRLHNYLIELSLKSAPAIKITKNQPKFFATEFNIGSLRYMFQAVSRREWGIDFAPVRYTEKDPELSIKEVLTLFSAVGKSLDMFLDTMDPDEFHFIPASPKLMKVYDRFAKMIDKKLPQYKYTKQDSWYNFKRIT